jgi:hypothetical protein
VVDVVEFSARIIGWALGFHPVTRVTQKVPEAAARLVVAW